jgi:hypothetical protein
MSFSACARSCCSGVEPDGAEVLAALYPEPAVEGAAVAGTVAGVVAALDGLGLLPHPASTHVAAMAGTSATLCHLGKITAPDPNSTGLRSPSFPLAPRVLPHARMVAW